MSSPYLTAVSPDFMGLSATLWPIGMSCLACSCSVLSLAVMTPSMAVPAFRPSTTTTPTLSFSLWTRKCGADTADLPPYFLTALHFSILSLIQDTPASCRGINCSYKMQDMFISHNALPGETHGPRRPTRH